MSENRRGTPLRVWERNPVLTILATALMTTYLVTDATLRAILSVPRRFAHALGLARAAARAPAITVASLGALILLIASPAWGEVTTGWRPELGTLARLAAFALAAGAFDLVAMELTNNPPATLDGVRASIDRRWPDRWLTKHFKEPLDAYWVQVAVNNTLLCAPPFVALFLDDFSIPLLVIYYYLAASSVTLGSQENLLHNNLHTDVFNWKSISALTPRLFTRALSMYVQLVLNPVCGRLPLTYDVQHMAHHAEDNSVDDVQTTVFIDRTSYTDYCRWGLLAGYKHVTGYELISYLQARVQTKQLTKVLKGLFAFWLGVALVSLGSPEAAAVAVIYNILVFGALSARITVWWHGFVDLDAPTNIYRNSINMNNPKSGHLYFGQANHADHHIRPGCHWTRAVAEATSPTAQQNHRREGTFAWKNPFTDQNVLLRLLWVRDYDRLASLWLMNGAAGLMAATPELIAARVRPLQPIRRGRAGVWIDEVLGRAVGAVLPRSRQSW